MPRQVVFVGAAPTPAPASWNSALGALFEAQRPQHKEQRNALSTLMSAANFNFKHRLVTRPAPELNAALRGSCGAVCVKRVEGSGAVQIVLFSTGIVTTLSEDPLLHGQCITFPVTAVQLKGKQQQQQQEQQSVLQPIIADAAAGEHHFVACDVEGRVYTWGSSNSYGQLGRGRPFAFNKALDSQPQPRALSNFGSSPPAQASTSAQQQQHRNTVIESTAPPRIVAVSCGRDHTVLLADTRRCVYVFGRAHRGQLGLKDATPSADGSAATPIIVDFVATPRSVPALFGLPVAQISCNSAAHHTLVVLESGHLIAMGENLCGNLGAQQQQRQQQQQQLQGGKKNAARATHQHCTAPTVIAIAKSAAVGSEYGHDAAAEFEEAAGRISFPQLPRRMNSLIPLDSKSAASQKMQREQPVHAKSAAPVPPAVHVAFVESGAMHTAVVDVAGHLFTAGVPPLRLQNGDQPVASLGSLGRPITAASQSVTFGPVHEFFVDRSAGDAVVCGAGFTAVLLRRLNAVYVTGGIQANPSSSDVTVGAGVEARSWLQLDLGHDRVGATGKVVQIFAAGKGLMVVVDE